MCELESEVNLELIDKSLAIATPPEHLDFTIPNLKDYKSKMGVQEPMSLDDKIRTMRNEVRDFQKS